MTTILKHTITTIALALLLLTAQAQTPPPLARQAEVGMPLLRHYPPQEYSGSPLVWSIMQDRRGVLFFGIPNTVLEYDGVTWRKIRVPGNGRSLALDAAGKIWVGCTSSFGWLEPDAHGTLQYVSLVEKIPAEHRRFDAVWQVLPAAQGIFFRSSARLFRWDGQRMQVWATKTSFEALAAVRGRIYTSQRGIGLQEVVGDALRDLPGGSAWKDSRWMFLHPYDEQRILISARDETLRLYDGAQALPFPTAVDEYLKKSDVFRSVPLPDGGYCLTTLKGGVVIIERDGRLRRIIDQEAGLPTSTAYPAYADREGALWLGLDNGIARVDIHSPISLFARVGISDVMRHGGTLYATAFSAGTAVYYLETNPITGLPTLQPLAASAAQAFALLPFQDPAGKAPPQLLAASAGVMNIKGKTVTPALPREEGLAQSARSLLQSRITPERVFAGRSASVSSLRWENGQWIDEGRIPTNSSVRTLVEEADGTLWASDAAGGVLHITVPTTGMRDAQVERFTEKDGLGPGEHRVFLADGQVLAIPSPTKDILRWEPATRRFVTDNRFLLPVNDPEAEARLRLLPNGDIWSQNGGFAERRQGLFRRQPDGTYQLDEEPFRGLSRFDFNNIFAEPDGDLWLASLDGLIRFDQRIKPAAPPPFATLVRRVSTGKGDVVFGGFTPDNAAPLRLPYANNSLRFAFAAPTYGDEAGTTYRYTLEGADRDWSGWDKQTEANYSSLGPGAYRLRVQARTSTGRVGEEGTYSFTILPPWYRSWWAYSVYALLLAAAIYAAARLLRRRVEAREQAKAALREAELRADAAAEKAKSLQAENEAYQRLKATQEQLLVQEKLASLGALTAGIAHEIKNPLNFVNNFADLSVELMDELREDIERNKAVLPAKDYENIEALLDDLTGNAKKINEHGKRADGIVRSMLLHSRGQTGERQATDINKLLEEYVNLTYHGMRAQDSSFNVTIERDLANDAGTVEAIPQDLSRVFLNLLNNACYAVNERAKKNGAGFVPTLRVRSVNLGDAVEIRIRDNGMGIPPEVRDKIFNPFFTTKPTGQGTGLGLSISHDIVVRQHGGQLDVETEPGKFTEFIVRLPRQGRKAS